VDHLVYFDYVTSKIHSIKISQTFLKLMLSLYNEDLEESKKLFDALDPLFKEKAIRSMAKMDS